MALDPIGLALQDRRPLSPAGPLDEILRRFVHGEHVVAVHDHAGHAVALGPVGDVVHRCGGPVGGGGGPLVVLAEEDHGQIPGRGHVGRLVEGSPVGGAVAEEGHGDSVGLLHLLGQRRAGGHGEAAAHDAVGAQHAHAEVGDVHGAALALAAAGALSEQLGHHVLQVGALGDGMAVPPVGALDIVGLSQVRHDARGSGFLADVQVDEPGDFSVKEKFLHGELEIADLHHGFIEKLQRFFIVPCKRKSRLFPYRHCAHEDHLVRILVLVPLTRRKDSAGHRSPQQSGAAKSTPLSEAEPGIEMLSVEISVPQLLNNGNVTRRSRYFPEWRERCSFP